MSDRQASAARETMIADVRSHTRHALAQIGLRLAHSLAQRFDRQQTPAVSGLADPARDMLAEALAFADQFARDLGPATRPPPPVHPLPRLEAIARVPSIAADACANSALRTACPLPIPPDATTGFPFASCNTIGKVSYKPLDAHGRLPQCPGTPDNRSQDPKLREHSRHS